MRCEQCNVEVTCPTKYCPLCGAPLVGDGAQEQLFVEPTEVRRWRHISAWGIYLLALVAISVLFVALNMSLTPDIPWSIVVVLLLFSGFVAIRYLLRDRAHLASKLFCLCVLLTALFVSIQRCTPNVNWAYNYAVPIMLFIGSVAMGTLAESREKGSGAYGLYVSAIALFGLLPLGLNIAFKEPNLISSLICVTGCGTVLIMVISTRMRQILSELQRRFHL